MCSPSVRSEPPAIFSVLHFCVMAFALEHPHMQIDHAWCPAGLLPKRSQTVHCCLFLLHFKNHAYAWVHTFKFTCRSVGSWKASSLLLQGLFVSVFHRWPWNQTLLPASLALPRVTESEVWDHCYNPHFKIGLSPVCPKPVSRWSLRGKYSSSTWTCFSTWFTSLSRPGTVHFIL